LANVIAEAGGQTALATRVGVSKMTVHLWTRGSMPNIAVAARLAELGIPVEAWGEPCSETETAA